MDDYYLLLIFDYWVFCLICFFGGVFELVKDLFGLEIVLVLILYIGIFYIKELGIWVCWKLILWKGYIKFWLGCFYCKRWKVKC